MPTKPQLTPPAGAGKTLQSRSAPFVSTPRDRDAIELPVDSSDYTEGLRFVSFPRLFYDTKDGPNIGVRVISPEFAHLVCEPYNALAFSLALGASVRIGDRAFGRSETEGILLLAYEALDTYRDLRTGEIAKGFRLIGPVVEELHFQADDFPLRSQAAKPSTVCQFRAPRF